MSKFRRISVHTREEGYDKIDGVKFEYNKTPVEITPEGVIFQDMERGEAVVIEGSQDKCI